MGIIRINELPEGSGSLSNDDIFLFMDDPSNGGTTKKISLSEIGAAIGGGGGGGNADTGDVSFNGIQIIGTGTLELVPNTGLYNNDQYLVVDPTAPNHIHLRAGGTQDGSSAELILGGEHANLRVTDNLHEVDVTSSIGGPVIVSFGVSCDNARTCETYLPPGTTVEYNGVVYTVTSYGIPNSCEETTEVFFSPGGYDTETNIPLFSDGSPITAIRPFIHKTWTFANDGNLSIPGNILLNNGTSVAVGSYDNNTGGQNGVSLNCAVGYELNWQGGRLKSTYNNGESAAAIFVDSPMSAPPVVLESVSNSNSINTNAKDGDMFDITLTENSTLANPTNPVNGKTLRWRITQDGTGNRTVTLGNKFNLPSSASSPLPWSTTANKMDILAATYHAGRDKWDIVAFVPGY